MIYFYLYYGKKRELIVDHKMIHMLDYFTVPRVGKVNLFLALELEVESLEEPVKLDLAGREKPKRIYYIYNLKN